VSDLGTSLSILWSALVAGLRVSLSHVPLGQQVLRRGIVFIDLAIAQVAALGVIVAQTLGLELNGVATQVAAVVAALLGAGHLPPRCEPAAPARLRARIRELPRRTCGLGRHGPPVERGDRVGHGGAGDHAAPDRAAGVRAGSRGSLTPVPVRAQPTGSVAQT
jgi:hypothetical protein